MIYKLKNSKRPFKVLEEESRDHNIKVRFLDRACQDDEAIFNDEDLAKASDWPLPVAKGVPTSTDAGHECDEYCHFFGCILWSGRHRT